MAALSRFVQIIPAAGDILAIRTSTEIPKSLAPMPVVPNITGTVPNQRSKDKAHLGGFVDRKLHREIVRLADAEGMADNKFGFVQKLIHEALARRRGATKKTKSPRK
jgi:hypothetical protein